MQPPSQSAGDEVVFSTAVDRWLDTASHLLERVTTRTALSLLILVSVLPPPVLGLAVDSPLYALFLLVFGPEFVVRLLLLERRRRQRRMRLSETVVLFFDLIAIVSFLPVASGAGLRFLRLARLLLLISYWQGLLLDLWRLVNSRERRYQVLLVLVLGVLLALGSAVLLVEVGVVHDFDGDEEIQADDLGFLHVFWWSFRQIQDPGNLVHRFEHPMVVMVSLLLTFAGLLLFSFFIGIGTHLVAELVERARGRPVSLRDHTVILGMTPYTSILLHELAEIYRKNLRPFRAAILADLERPDDLADPTLRYFEFRRGDPARATDLERVAIERARRVIILGSATRHPDASVIGALLAARRIRHNLDIYPDLEHERNFHAALAAGGQHTHLVGSGSMLGYFVAQNVAYPGVQRLYRELLRSAGCEIYSYIFSADELRRWRDANPPDIDVRALHELAFQRHDTTLLGVLIHPDASIDSDPRTGSIAGRDDAELEFLPNPLQVCARPANRASDDAASRDDERWRYALGRDGGLRRDAIHGLVGVAVRFRNLQNLGRDVVHGALNLGGPETRGGRAADASTWDPELRLVPPRKAPRKVLILGAGQRVPRVVTELLALFRELEISIVADTDEDWITLAHDTSLMLSPAFGDRPDWQREDGIWRLHLRCLGDRPGEATVTLMQADWTHSHRLREGAAVTLDSADVILLLPTRDPTHSSDPSDGRNALDCLHLANLQRTGAVHFQPGVQILALVRDPVKGELLESRLAAMVRADDTSGTDQGPLYTVISRELTRHRYIVQNVFVRGLNAVYLELLSSRGQSLTRLVARGRDGLPLAGSFEPVELAGRLLARQLVLVGYEHRSAHAAADAEPDIVLDPHRFKLDGKVPWREVEALYVLGEGDAVAAFGPIDAA